MKLSTAVLKAFVSVISIFSAISAFAQQPEEPDLFEQAEKEADRLQRVLDLEDWQTFYVDSTLKHDYTAMMADYERLRESKVTNLALYQDAQDKWMDQIDLTYRKIFTDEQWKAYLRSGAGKNQKARAKRREKAQGK